MATFGYEIYKNILFEAAYAGRERAALTNLRRFDHDGDSSNGYQINYSFMADLPDYFANRSIVGFQSPAEDFRQAMRSILGGIEGNTFAVDMGLNYLSPQQSISKGMQIAAAVTPTDTNAAIALTGVNPAQIDLA